MALGFARQASLTRNRRVSTMRRTPRVVQLWVALVQLWVRAAESLRSQNVVIMPFDDWGYNDFGRYSTDIGPNANWAGATPHADALSREGITFSQYYVAPKCTCSRVELLTGRYALHSGLQMKGDNLGEPRMSVFTTDGMRTTEVLIAEEFRAVGYSTYHVGKWHVGFASRRYWPSRRGFDSSYGYLALAYLFHYTKHGARDATRESYRDGFIDLWANESSVSLPAELDTSVHSVDLMQAKAEEMLRNHTLWFGADISDREDASPHRRFFLYYAMQNPHAPVYNYEHTEQVNGMTTHIRESPDFPIEYVDECAAAGSLSATRQLYCGLCRQADEMLGRTLNVLNALGHGNSTVFILFSDNGGDPESGGFNWPLRGVKKTPFEGGVRSHAVLWGPAVIPRRLVGTNWNGLIHISDWLPTCLQSFAGQHEWDRVGTLPLDGMNVWPSITSGTSSPRQEIVHADNAIRVGDLKLLVNMKSSSSPTSIFSTSSLDPRAIRTIQYDLALYYSHNFNEEVTMLYNISADPSEQVNLASQQSSAVSSLSSRLRAWTDVTQVRGAGTDTLAGTEAAQRAVQADENGHLHWMPYLPDGVVEARIDGTDAIVEITVPANSGTTNLYFQCHVTSLASDEETVEAIVRWTRADGTGPMLHRKFDLSSSRDASASLMRISPKTLYRFELFACRASTCAPNTEPQGRAAELWSARAMISRIDQSEPFVRSDLITNTLSAELFAMDIWFGDSSDVNVIVLDNLGHVVWEQGVCDGAGSAIFQVPELDHCIVCSPDSRAISAFDPLGRLLSSFDLNACSVAGAHINHEITVLRDEPNFPVLTLQETARYFDDMRDHRKWQLAEHVLRVDWVDRTTAVEASPWDIYDVEVDRGVLSNEGDMDKTGSFLCTGSQLPPRLDEETVLNSWLHGNSISVSLFDPDVLIISYRHISTVTAVRRNGGGVLWHFSTELPWLSSFTFANDGTTEPFYNQHDVTQLPNGNIVMIDNGNTRPQPGGAGRRDWSRDLDVQYSRAVEYRLDFETMVASQAWKMRPGLYSSHGGSVRPAANGGYIVSFCCDNEGFATHAYPPASEPCSTIIFELDSVGHVAAKMLVPFASDEQAHWTLRNT